MIVEKAMHPDWLSNSYLVAEGPGADALIVDAGAPAEAMIAAIDRHGVVPTHLFLTHHHRDHVAELETYVERYGVQTLAHPLEAELIDGGVDRTVDAAAELFRVGALTVGALHTPGHTAGMLNPVVDGSDVFTGDTLFRGSVGGVRAPGSTGFADLRASVMDVLMALAPDTRLHPGHTDPTTVAEEWEHNPFVRLWRGVDAPGAERVTALDEPATLVLWAGDYDDGHKAWVRWEDGRDDIVPGSRVQRSDAVAPNRP